jgi:2-C-methyl-D-erythritol 4-phosphate cytidylyltransferase
MLHWSVDALRAVQAVTQIVIALPGESLDAAPPGTIAVAGGQQRSHSVRNALDGCPRGDVVIVHDAARPLARPQLFADALAELIAHPDADAVVAAAPVSDTIKEVGEDGHTVTRTLHRAGLWAVQTPQVFRRAALARVLGEASEAVLASATDDAALIEQAGGRVRVLRSDPSNLKVTTPTDLQVAELLLAGRRAAPRAEAQPR